MANENDPELVFEGFALPNIPIPVILQVNHLESLHDDKNDDKKVVIIEPYSSVEYGERRVYRKNDIGFFPGMESCDEGDVWFRTKLQRHSHGDFSIAAVQANTDIQEHCQVETNGTDGSYVGIFDGHCGSSASSYVAKNMFTNIMRFAKESGSITEGVLRNAFRATENGFMSVVSERFINHPLIASVGTSALVGILWKKTLFVANLGDSRAVLGSVNRSGDHLAKQLTVEHNANKEEVRQRLQLLHPEDQDFVVFTNNSWRVKGMTEVTRSIGDAYLKKSRFALDDPRFRLPEPLVRPALTAEPSLYKRTIRSEDRFLIFASDGLWQHISNQEAVEMVFNSPREGIARKLVKAALDEASRKSKSKYHIVKRVPKGERKKIHDDITVVVVFIEHPLLAPIASEPLSVRSFINSIKRSDFFVEGDDKEKFNKETCETKA